VQVETSTGVTQVEDTHASAWIQADHIIVDHRFGNGAPVTIDLLNSAGQMLSSRTVAGGSGRVELSTEGVAAGLLFVRVTNMDARLTFALPVEQH
jgi:hypothetical protein